MFFQQTRRFQLVAFFVCLSALFLSQLQPAVAVEQSDPEATGVRQVREFRGRTMGTTYMVKVAGHSDVDDETIRLSVDAELRTVNDQMSTYLKSSEITKFNESKSTDWFEVSKEFAAVVEFAQQVAAKTDGAFDVTVGPLVDLWSFGASERSRTIPTDEQIDRAITQVGYESLSVRLDPPALKKSIPSLRIDLSSIAKGHGVDRVVERLASLGVDDVFVEIGGEVRTAGDKPGGPWRVGIQLPDAERDTVMIAHPMIISDESGNAMATSGDYRNFFTVDGKRYSHTIDPRTGRPVEHSLASATVIAPTCMEADAWATAFCVLGAEKGFELAEEESLHTLLVARNQTTADDDGDSPAYEFFGTGVLAEDAKQASKAREEGKSFLATVIPMAILSFGVFSILLFAMAVGVLFGKRSISGSCGGLANQKNPDGSTNCSLCSNPSDACKELRDKMSSGERAEV
jgi:thiamine biosynthesis lipoprotein